jgi:hypothetical protein
MVLETALKFHGSTLQYYPAHIEQFEKLLSIRGTVLVFYLAAITPRKAVATTRMCSKAMD